jgi:hypothetical protein
VSDAAKLKIRSMTSALATSELYSEAGNLCFLSASTLQPFNDFNAAKPTFRITSRRFPFCTRVNG